MTKCDQTIVQTKKIKNVQNHLKSINMICVGYGPIWETF